MKYSKAFERDFKFYLRTRHLFKFDGAVDYFSKHGEPLVVYSPDGVDGKHAFYAYDSQGRILATKHPNLLRSLLKTKGAVNMQIKSYAQGRADGTLPLLDAIGIYVSLQVPDWFYTAVESQKFKYYAQSTV